MGTDRGAEATGPARANDRSRVRAALEALRAHPLFADLPAEDLDRICRVARRLSVPAGDAVLEEGTPGDGLYIVIAGRLEVTTREGGREVVLATRGPGDFLGEMSLLEQAPRSASARAVEPAELMVVDPADFRALLAASPRAAAAVLQVLARRLRSTEAALMQQEKLASLGTLAAGLAHELNNPAAAIRRASDHLGTALDELRRHTADLVSLRMHPDLMEAVARWPDRPDRRPARDRLDPLSASRQEQSLAGWLEQHGVAGAWELAASLAAAGLDAPSLAELLGPVEPAARDAVARWLAAALTARDLLDEIAISARAVSRIVGAVRSYAYLDRTPLQDVDVRESLETTLVILRHRLGPEVAIQREYDPDLPLIEAYAGQLNQVWTNLIANALDAIDGAGTLGLSAHSETDHVAVRITDSGPGVPDELQTRIFEPFFTTKEPGRGTGLGLHIARDIVVNHHRGRIAVDSRPGHTTFTVTLPLRLGPDGR
jgi:signal transduction histidine kinase